jgi:hypothetical protein
MSMGWFDWLFGNLQANPRETESAVRRVTPHANQEPPEFVRCRELQQAHWTFNATELRELAAREAALNWPERLRLHHLLCLQLLNDSADRNAANERCRQSLQRLLAIDSPYRPRIAMVWQGEAADPDDDREPNFQGTFLNASVTHLGSLEVFRVDDDFKPIELKFVSFDEITNIMFARASLLRAAKVFYEDGRDEVALLPLLYGLTWERGNEYDRDGRMTRFVAHLESDELATLGGGGIGVGQQDFFVRSPQGEGGSLFGMGSVASISFALEMSDPRFDEKARARGIDPNEVRRTMPKPE